VPRCVTIVLLDADGVLLGALPPFDVDIQWWNAVADVNRAVRDRYGLDVQVLRLLHAVSAPVHGVSAPAGGNVTYLAQASGSACTLELTEVVVVPVHVNLADDPLRAPFARPGGPAATLRWAGVAVLGLGRGPVLGVEQRRTWNLSAIWRLDTADTPLWIKEVPHFFDHEPVVLSWLAASGHAASFPTLLASDGGRMLLENIPGEDLFQAPVAVRAAIARDLHPAQLHGASRVDELLTAGVPDRRFAALRPILADVARDARATDPVLDRLMAGLDDRLAEVATCGLPDTLCHGDLHPGNVRAVPDGPNVIIDWGDSFVGSPAFDILRLTETLSDGESAGLIDAWAARWLGDLPGCDPQRAVHLLRPVAALRNAAVYASFLADIEPSEHPYHADDPPLWLARAAESFGAESFAAESVGAESVAAG
jgi:Phosphotransferase enzyme family